MDTSWRVVGQARAKLSQVLKVKLWGVNRVHRVKWNDILSIAEEKASGGCGWGIKKREGVEGEDASVEKTRGMNVLKGKKGIWSERGWNDYSPRFYRRYPRRAWLTVELEVGDLSLEPWFFSVFDLFQNCYSVLRLCSLHYLLCPISYRPFSYQNK